MPTRAPSAARSRWRCADTGSTNRRAAGRTTRIYRPPSEHHVVADGFHGRPGRRAHRPAEDRRRPRNGPAGRPGRPGQPLDRRGRGPNRTSQTEARLGTARQARPDSLSPCVPTWPPQCAAGRQRPSATPRGGRSRTRSESAVEPRALRSPRPRPRHARRGDRNMNVAPPSPDTARRESRPKSASNLARGSETSTEGPASG